MMLPEMIVYAILASPSAPFIDELEPAPQSEPTSAQIQQWIEQLDDDDFNVRERADRQLTGLRQPNVATIIALVKASAGDSPERKFRAAHIARHHLSRANRETLDRWTAALQAQGLGDQVRGWALERRQQLSRQQRVFEQNVLSAIFRGEQRHQAVAHIELKGLDLRDTDYVFLAKHAAALRGARTVKFSECQISAAGMDLLQHFPHVWKVDFGDSEVEGGIPSLADLRKRFPQVDVVTYSPQ